MCEICATHEENKKVDQRNWSQSSGVKKARNKESSGRKLKTGKYLYLFNYSATLAQVWISSPLKKDIERGMKIRTYLEESVVYVIVLKGKLC